MEITVQKIRVELTQAYLKLGMACYRLHRLKELQAPATIVDKEQSLIDRRIAAVQAARDKISDLEKDKNG